MADDSSPLPADQPPANPPPADGAPANPPPADGAPANPPPADGAPANPPPADQPPANPPPADGAPANPAAPPKPIPPSDPPPKPVRLSAKELKAAELRRRRLDTEELVAIVVVGLYTVAATLIFVILLVQLLSVDLKTPISAGTGTAATTETATVEASSQAGDATATLTSTIAATLPAPTNEPTATPDTVSPGTGSASGASSTGGETTPDKDKQPFYLLSTQVYLNQEMQLMLLVIMSGALGGLIHGIRSYIYHVAKRDQKNRWQNRWIPYYVLRPFQGGVLAMGFYVVIRAGFVPEINASSNPFGFLATAALVGLFSEQALEKLKKIAEATFEKVPDDSPPDMVNDGLMAIDPAAEADDPGQPQG